MSGGLGSKLGMPSVLARHESMHLLDSHLPNLDFAFGPPTISSSMWLTLLRLTQSRREPLCFTHKLQAKCLANIEAVPEKSLRLTTLNVTHAMYAKSQGNIMNLG